MKPGSSCYKLPFKEEEEIKQETASSAAAKEFSVDAAAVAVSLEMDGIFTFKE